jgi:perosamine synthetase
MGSQDIPLSKPDLSPLETSLVMEVMRNEWLAIGPMTEEFEERVAAFVGTRHAVAVNSGTSGLFCVLKALGIGPGRRGDHDAVLSFVASTNVILHAGRRPVFVDIEPVSLNMDPGSDRAGDHASDEGDPGGRDLREPDAHGPVRGHRARHGLAMIEDCCEALGGRAQGAERGDVRSRRVSSGSIRTSRSRPARAG